MTRKIIFGDLVSVPENKITAVRLETRKSGTIGEHYGREYHYLKVIFLIGDTPIEKEILLAMGTDGYGDAKPINEKLFRLLHRDGFGEDQKTELSTFLMDKYEEGEVREKDMMAKINEIFLIE